MHDPQHTFSRPEEYGLSNMITLGSEISTIGGWSTIRRIEGDSRHCAKVLLATHRRYRREFPDPTIIGRNTDGISVHQDLGLPDFTWAANNADILIP